MNHFFLKFIFLLFYALFLLSCEKSQDNPKKQTSDTREFKVYKLAIIDAQEGEPYQSARENMLDTLKKNGYEIGKNLSIIHFSIGNDLNKGKEVLKEIAKKDYDVIFSNGTLITKAVKESEYFNNPKFKFVFACVTDPVGLGVIEGFGIKNKWNVTGVSYPVPVESRLKFVKELLPNLKTIGLIYANMPQSISYRKWVEDAIRTVPELKGIQVIFKVVPFITGENGSRKMAEGTKEIIKQLDKKVDVFLSPNDQMGVQEPFAQTVWNNATKPLIGIGNRDVLSGWGATASIYPSHESMGFLAAQMIIQLFNQKNIQDIPAQWPKEYGFAFDLKKAKKFDINIPIKLIELAGQNIVK